MSKVGEAVAGKYLIDRDRKKVTNTAEYFLKNGTVTNAWIDHNQNLKKDVYGVSIELPTAIRKPSLLGRILGKKEEYAPYWENNLWVIVVNVNRRDYAFVANNGLWSEFDISPETFEKVKEMVEDHVRNFRNNQESGFDQLIEKFGVPDRDGVEVSGTKRVIWK